MEEKELLEQEKAANEEQKKKNKNEKSEETYNRDDEIKELKEKLREAEEKYVRIAAELDNYRKRTEKETRDKLKFANQQIITNLLTVIDHLDMAINHITPDSSLESLKEGVELTLKQLNDIFEKFGVKEIPCCVGEEFDPNLHEAMMLDETDEHEDNKITMVLQKGYQLNDRVIRPAKVKVNKKKKSSSEE